MTQEPKYWADTDQDQTEIDRLNAVNAELVAALERGIRRTRHDGPCWCGRREEGSRVIRNYHNSFCTAARAAIAKAKESNP